jgi:hypothetical protein
MRSKERAAQANGFERLTQERVGVRFPENCGVRQRERDAPALSVW